MKNYKIIGFNPLILGNPSIFVRDFSRSVLENIISLIEADELLASLNPRSLVSSEPLKTNDASESFLKNSNETGQSYGQQLTNFVSPNFTIESQTAFATNSYSSYLSQIGSRENFSISEIKVSPTTKINHTLSEKLDRIELESGFFRNNASSSNIILANAVVEKIHSNLLQDIIAAARRTQLQFVARIKAGTDLDAYTEQWFVRPSIDPLGSTVASGFASASALLKMASDAKVISLQRAESLLEVPTKFSDPDVAAAIEARSRPEPQGWFHTGGAIHGSQEAWAKGYTGKGVRYMSNDSGADYAHPDLLGTWAYIEDPASPYYGLPQMFDSWSSYVAAFDFRLGTSFIADGVADYADTSATALGNFRYSPLGAKVEHNYIVPNTSLSGVYHYGSHPDKALAKNAKSLNEKFGDGTAVEGERAAILVVDEEKAGVYDTVYVDLNFNFDFTDETPARLTRDFTYQEVAALDYNNDNLNDISGGLVYFISDGKTALPTLDWYWGIPGSFFGNGDLVAFHVMDDSEGGGDHGMGTTSVAVGQGVVTGSVFAGPDGPPQAGGRGLVVGPGKDVASTQNGNWYISPFIEDGYIYAGLGYDGISGTSDDIQIVSNSWGFSGINNDGYDYQSRLIDSINRTLAPNTALLFSTGNGAPGYGTVAPPSPASGIGVGASTLFGSIGLFESIASAKQIVGGDVMSWSNRGPGVNIDAGVDVVATGAFGTGADPLNQTMDGAIATSRFGGTSMAAPVAAGNLALMYQAWYERTGKWPTFEEAKAILMGSAKNTNHDVWSQGAGLVNATVGVEPVFATPVEWSVGDYRGKEYEAFAHIIGAGDRDTETFTIHNYSGKKIKAKVRATTFKRIGKRDYSFTSLDRSLDHGDFTTPDYAFRIDPHIPKKTDLLQVRVTKPYEQFDPNQDLTEPFNNWRVHLQNWTDLNGDGKYWVDRNGNKKVDLEGEMQTGEHIRFSYGYNTGPMQQVRMANPLERIDDGLLLTFRHQDQIPEVPTTDLTVEASFWKKTKWPWLRVRKNLTLMPNSATNLPARIKVPKNTPYGMYEGAIEIVYENDENNNNNNYDAHTVTIPVTVAVAAEGTSFNFGQTNFTKKRAQLYDNKNLFGYTDYSWREESGDWRFYWTDIPAASLPASGDSFLVIDTAWKNRGTDIDTIVFGPTSDDFSPSDVYGPYTLEEVGGSKNTYIGSGRWGYQTSSGGPQEIISAPVREGLHGIALHQVRVDGSTLNEPFSGSVGLANLNPGKVTGTNSGSAEITISSEIKLSSFVAEGFGLGKPVTTRETVFQDDPDDPSTASFLTTVDINHGGLLEVSTAESAKGSDIDLYLYGPDNILLNSSTTPTDEESVEVLFPKDGTYTIAVHGWSVAAGVDTFELTVNAIQGYDLTVTKLPNSIPAGATGTVSVEWDTTGFALGTYNGIVTMGPTKAPGLFEVPVEVLVA